MVGSRVEEGDKKRNEGYGMGGKEREWEARRNGGEEREEGDEGEKVEREQEGEG